FAFGEPVLPAAFLPVEGELVVGAGLGGVGVGDPAAEDQEAFQLRRIADRDVPAPALDGGLVQPRPAVGGRCFLSRGKSCQEAEPGQGQAGEPHEEGSHEQPRNGGGGKRSQAATGGTTQTTTTGTECKSRLSGKGPVRLPGSLLPAPPGRQT